MSDHPRPTEIKLQKQSATLEVAFDNGERFNMPAEYLRVHSPSAEVRGHGPGEEVLQVGKEEVNITHVEAVGQYAVLLRYDDGHDTGIYSWDELYRLGSQYQTLWKSYLQRLEAAGHKRKEAS